MCFLIIMAALFQQGGSLRLEAQDLVVSHYGPGFEGNIMSSGLPFDSRCPIAAHKRWVFGTIVEIWNPVDGKKFLAIVLDRGPYISGRSLDVAKSLAEGLGIREEGPKKRPCRVAGKVEVTKDLYKHLVKAKDKQKFLRELLIRN